MNESSSSSIRVSALRALALALFLGWGDGAVAQSPQSEDPPTGVPRWAASLHFENDLFADTDAQYTNGIKLTVVSPDINEAFERRREFSPGVQRVMNWLLPYIPFGEDDDIANTLAFSIGQNMYTPDDTQARDLNPDDRPYAGWLYFATTFQTRTPRRQDTFDVQVGVVGPPSLGEQAQNFVHRIRGIDETFGWNHQIRFEPGIVLAYERVVRSHLLLGTTDGLGVDALARFGGALGNIAIYASSGLQLRVGWNLPPDFGYSVIRPGGVTEVNTVPASSERGSAEANRRAWLRRKGFSAYAFAGATGRLVLRDIFLDGNSFRDSHDVDSRALVADLMAGVSIGYQGFKLSLAKVLRTREFRGQRRNQRFGSITLSYAF